MLLYIDLCQFRRWLERGIIVCRRLPRHPVSPSFGISRVALQNASGVRRNPVIAAKRRKFPGNISSRITGSWISARQWMCTASGTCSVSHSYNVRIRFRSDHDLVNAPASSSSPLGLIASADDGSRISNFSCAQFVFALALSAVFPIAAHSAFRIGNKQTAPGQLLETILMRGTPIRTPGFERGPVAGRGDL
jgi:hypothetical protein